LHNYLDLDYELVRTGLADGTTKKGTLSCSEGSRPIRPALGISPGAQDCEDYNPARFCYIEDSIGKTTNQGAADILVYDRLQFGGALNGRQSGIDAEKKRGT
jgi:hypothetical protein